MKRLSNLFFIAIMLTSLSFTAQSQNPESVTLITNVNVFDGVNEKLIQGADILIKFAAGGGVASVYDPVEVRQYSLEEMKAITYARSNYIPQQT